MANECIPLYRPGGDLTATAGAGGVTGKTFVNLTTAPNPTTGALPVCSTAAAAGLSVGVAAYNADAGKTFPIIRTPGAIVPITAGGVFAAGVEVEVGANGRAVALAAGKARGRAWTAGVADTDAFIELY